MTAPQACNRAALTAQPPDPRLVKEVLGLTKKSLPNLFLLVLSSWAFKDTLALNFNRKNSLPTPVLLVLSSWAFKDILYLNHCSIKFYGIVSTVFKRSGRQDEQDEIWKVKLNGIVPTVFKRIGRQDEQDEIWKVLILVESCLRSLITVFDEIYLV